MTETVREMKLQKNATEERKCCKLMLSNLLTCYRPVVQLLVACGHGWAEAVSAVCVRTVLADSEVKKSRGSTQDTFGLVMGLTNTPDECYVRTAISNCKVP